MFIRECYVFWEARGWFRPRGVYLRYMAMPPSISFRGGKREIYGPIIAG